MVQSIPCHGAESTSRSNRRENNTMNKVMKKSSKAHTAIMAAKRNDIPIGRENAIPWQELALKWNTDQRGVRLIIAELRASKSGDGYAILSTTRGRGYWRSDNSEEIDGFVAEIEAMSRHLHLATKDAKRILKDLRAQKEYKKLLDDVG